MLWNYFVHRRFDLLLFSFLTGPHPICNERIELTNEVTVIRSPNYPSEYFNSLHCQWVVMAPEGYQIIGKLRNFLTEANFDYVVLGTGNDPNNRTTAFAPSSGAMPPGSRLYDVNALWLVFASDELVGAPGFEYEVLAVRMEECE